MRSGLSWLALVFARMLQQLPSFLAWDLRHFDISAHFDSCNVSSPEYCRYPIPAKIRSN